jgi:hypothetical protein
MVDTHDSKSCDASHESSSLSSGTKSNLQGEIGQAKSIDSNIMRVRVSLWAQKKSLSFDSDNIYSLLIPKILPELLVFFCFIFFISKNYRLGWNLSRFIHNTKHFPLFFKNEILLTANENSVAR